MKPCDYELTKEIKIDHHLGYKYFIDKKHPLSSKYGKTYYHRHVAFLKLGRWLTKKDDVHHIDKNKLNNNPDNLKILSRFEHAKLHAPKSIRIKIICPQCNKGFYILKSKKEKRTHCSIECNRKSQEKINWPNTNWLKRIVKEYSYSHLSRKLGVSDNAIRKRIKNHL